MDKLKQDFTVAQAQDLARHFLGPHWVAAQANVRERTWCELRFLRTPSQTFPTLGKSFTALTWRWAFRQAGVELPAYRPRFAADGYVVYKGAERVCVAGSKSLSKRIANALNEYVPGERGI